MKEEVVRGPRSLRATEKISQTDSPMLIGEIVATNEMRLSTGLRELDRVLGGGGCSGINHVNRRRSWDWENHPPTASLALTGFRGRKDSVCLRRGIHKPNEDAE